ncbi:hypothetical protein NKG94_18685 [Micromonospora sp. M12]
MLGTSLLAGFAAVTRGRHPAARGTADPRRVGRLLRLSLRCGQSDARHVRVVRHDRRGVVRAVAGPAPQRARILVLSLPVVWALITVGSFLAWSTWAAAGGMLVIGFVVAFAGWATRVWSGWRARSSSSTSWRRSSVPAGDPARATRRRHARHRAARRGRGVPLARSGAGLLPAAPHRAADGVAAFLDDAAAGWPTRTPIRVVGRRDASGPTTW